LVFYLLVGLGSAAGGAARYALSWLVDRYLDSRFPWGTFAINLTGSFVIGLFFGATGSGELFIDAPTGHLVLTYGFLGGYTTFSTFTLEALGLIHRRRTQLAVLYLTASVITCFLGAAAGYLIGIAL
jgi:fluoride exporter